MLDGLNVKFANEDYFCTYLTIYNAGFLFHVFFIAAGMKITTKVNPSAFALFSKAFQKPYVSAHAQIPCAKMLPPIIRKRRTRLLQQADMCSLSYENRQPKPFFLIFPVLHYTASSTYSNNSSVYVNTAINDRHKGYFSNMDALNR
uniref:Uncharacterized protein n=1 Tax=Glossina austeni TaxID=7395 RepID=A0A1A9V101_GLOAU